MTDPVITWSSEDEARAAQEGWYLWQGRMQSTRYQPLNSSGSQRVLVDKEDDHVLYKSLEKRAATSTDPWYKHALEFVDWWTMMRTMKRSGDWP